MKHSIKTQITDKLNDLLMKIIKKYIKEIKTNQLM